MSAQDYLTDVLLGHQIYLQRYASKRTEAINRGLDGLTAEIREALGEAATVEDLVGIRARIREMVARTEIGVEVQRIVDELPSHEVAFVQETVGRAATLGAVNLISPVSMAAIVTSRPVLLTSTTGAKTIKKIDDLVADFAGEVERSVITVIRAGVVAGDPGQKIAREVGRLVESRTRRQAQTLVRTIVNHIGSVARQEVASVNTDIIEGERFVATLDSRTTLLCASLDGRQFGIGLGPMPPLHWSCRSIRVPIVDLGTPGMQGERPAVGATGPTTVGAKTRYASWLRRQPRAFVEDVLGPARAKLFMDSKYSLDKFVDNNFKVLTLKELAAKDAYLLDNFVR